jgi:hypothetical protein
VPLLQHELLSAAQLHRIKHVSAKSFFDALKYYWLGQQANDRSSRACKQNSSELEISMNVLGKIDDEYHLRVAFLKNCPAWGPHLE